VARYGGEESLIVLPETSLTDALAVAQKMRAVIAAHPFQITNGTINVTASFGVAGYESPQAQDEASVDHLIAGANLCLYQSKEAGRNRVTGTAVGSGASLSSSAASIAASSRSPVPTNAATSSLANPSSPSIDSRSAFQSRGAFSRFAGAPPRPLVCAIGSFAFIATGGVS
jgi:hypothetical protein